jgi:hypothetical protein
MVINLKTAIGNTKRKLGKHGPIGYIYQRKRHPLSTTIYIPEEEASPIDPYIYTRGRGIPYRPLYIYQRKRHPLSTPHIHTVRPLSRSDKRSISEVSSVYQCAKNMYHIDSSIGSSRYIGT